MTFERWLLLVLVVIGALLATPLTYVLLNS